MRSVLSLLRRSCLIIGAALLLGVSLAGCSAVRLGYDQGPLLAYWWLDSRLDFDARQTERVKVLVGQWFDWHRATQLDGYAAALARAQAESAAPASAAQMCRWAEEWRERAAVAMQHLAPAVAEIAQTLGEPQIARLERRLSEDRRKLREEELDVGTGKRQAASAERTMERYERLYGKLDAAQRELVRDSIRRSPYEPQRRLDDLAWRHGHTVDMLRRLTRERPAAEPAQTLVRATITAILEPPQPDASAYRARWLQHQCELAAQLQTSASAAQRRHVRERLQEWEADARALASKANAATTAAASR